MTIKVDSMKVDLIASPSTEIEIAQEAGCPGRFKLYIHQGGVTIVRVCKLWKSQLTIDRDAK